MATVEMRQPDVFMSYSSVDRSLVERVAERLRANSIVPWLDRWNLTAGDRWQDEIIEALRASRACAVIIGPNGLGDWAREELAVALDRAAKDRAFRVFMVLLPGAPDPLDANLAFLRTRGWVDLRSGIAESDGIRELIAAITGKSSSQPTSIETDVCPYRGLETFDEEHAEFFFGRDDDVKRVVEKLKHTRFLGLLGPSGSGKSSLVRAGAIPAIRSGALPGSDRWAVRVFTPGAQPLGVLAAQLVRLFPDQSMHRIIDEFNEDERVLDLLVTLGIADRPPEERVLLVVDQFEELFTLCTDERQRAAFLANLLHAATIPGGRCMVVVAMRADFYHRCANHPELASLISAQQFLVGPLDAEALRQAIEEPAWRAGLELEAGLAETILDDVADRPGTLPLVEHVLFELWNNRRGRTLTLEAYVDNDGVEGALAQRANSIYMSFSPRQQEIARRLLLRLIQPGEGVEITRRRADMAELLGRPEEEADVETVTESLADQRLLTVGRDAVSGERVVEITHEALVRGWPRLRAWIDESRDALRYQRHLTEASTVWSEGGSRDEDLYRGARLSYWKERSLGELSPPEQGFLAASRRQEAREEGAARRRVRVAIGGVVAATATVAIVALSLLQRVADERDVARSGQLTAQALAALEGDPAEGLRLAVKALEARSTQEAESTLRRAIATPGSRVSVLRGHEDGVQGVAVSPDGQWLVSTGRDGTVRVWPLSGGSEPILLLGHQGAVNGAVFSPDARHVASAGEDSTVRVWDLSSRIQLAVLRPDKGVAVGGVFTADGTLVTAWDDGTVRLWDWAAGAAPRILNNHEGGLLSAAFSADGNRMASAGADGTVRVWDVVDGGDPRVLGRHEGGTTWTALAPNEKWVATTGRDGSLAVWDLAGGGQPRVLRSPGRSANSAAFSPDSRRVVSSGEGGVLRVWEWADGGEPIVLRGHENSVYGAVFSPDGSRVVSGGEDRTVRVWDWATGGQSRALRGHQGDVYSAAFSPDGRRVVSAGADGTVRVWDWAVDRPPIVLRGHESNVYFAVFSRDGSKVVSAGEDGTARVWDWASGDEPTVLRGHAGGVIGATFSPDGRRVATSGRDGTVRVWDWTSASEPTVMRGHKGVVTSVAFLSDGKLVSGGIDGRLRLWDPTAGRQLSTLRGHEAGVASVATTADGRRVVSAGEDGTVRVWDWASAKELVVLRGHRGPVYAAAFSPDSKRVTSAGVDATVRVWELDGGGGAPAVLRGHNGDVYAAAFSPDGKRVVTSGEDGTVRIWDCTGCGPIRSVLAFARSRVVS